jgi:hypothetical protein
MSQQQNNPTSSSPSSGPKVDRRKNRIKARSQFDSSAPKISVDRFFSDFTQNRRNNIEFDFDFESLKRLDAVYLPKVKEFADFSSRDDFNPAVLVAQIRLLIRCVIFRKMLLATPESQKTYIAKYNFVRYIDLFAPPSLLACVENIGKFEFDDFVGRIRNNVHNIHLMAVEVVKQAFAIDSFRNNYDDFLVLAVRAANFNNCFFVDKSSCDMIRQRGIKFLSDLYEIDFDVRIGEINCRLSYPRLKISSDDAEQVQYLSEWFEKLNGEMPEINAATRAGLCLIVSERWFSGVHYNRPINSFVDGLPDWVTITPSMFITALEYQRFDYNAPSDFTQNYLQALQDVFSYVQDIRSSPLNSILKFSKMSDNAFGTKSQIVVVPDKCFDDKSLPTFDDVFYSEAKPSIYGECLFKLKEKGLVTNQLIFSFTKNVEYKTIYEARLNGNVLNTRKMYLNPDFRYMN